MEVFYASGWKAACDKACEELGVTWGGGETQATGGIIEPGYIMVAASCMGIKDKK